MSNKIEIPVVDADGYLVKMIEGRILKSNREYDTYGEACITTYTIKIPRGLDVFQIESALGATFYHRCHCAHDCCGHWQYRLDTVRHTKRREWRVVVRSHANV